ncbi:MAG: CoA ester lyase [Actinophytocola sp.]|nr:CoA ester lyase [Actinophytocola sp.]
MEFTLRTVLFVPGDHPSRIRNAVACGPDAVAVDLEDAVAEGGKREAREAAVGALLELDSPAVSVMVRVNGVGSSHLGEDVACLAPILPRLSAVILPKVESCEDVLTLAQLLERVERSAGMDVGGTRVVATTETAAGILAAGQIAAASDRMLTLLFGSADLSAELRVSPTPDGTELLTARSTVVLAAAAAGLVWPLDGPYLILDDDEGLQRSAAAARSLGFGGKAAIHPGQLSTITATFAPTSEELAWAYEVDRAFAQGEREGRSAIRLGDGTFIDYPIARRARALLEGGQAEGNSP